MNENMKVKWFDEEIEVYDEKRVVNKSTSTITLNYIPSKTRPLTVENKGVMLMETEGVPSENEYVADRENGLLLFNAAMSGRLMVINYAAVGQWCIGAEKVYTNIDNQGNAIETLEELIEENRNAIESIKIIGDSAKVIQEMQGALDSISGFSGNIVEGGRINSELVANTEISNKANSELTSTISKANSTIDEMNDWIEQHGDIAIVDKKVSTLDAAYNKIANQDIPSINSSLGDIKTSTDTNTGNIATLNTDKQDKTDSALLTTSKNITGAINELVKNVGSSNPISDNGYKVIPGSEGNLVLQWGTFAISNSGYQVETQIVFSKPISQVLNMQVTAHDQSCVLTTSKNIDKNGFIAVARAMTPSGGTGVGIGSVRIFWSAICLM